MADDLATLTAQRAQLQALRAKGLRAVEYSDRRVEYRTDAEVAAALADIDRRIAALQGTRVNTVRIHSSKGL